MSESPSEDVAEQSRPVGFETTQDLAPEEDEDGPRDHGDEVNPADAAEQEREVPVDEEEWR